MTASAAVPTAPTAPATATATELAAALRCRQLSSRELLELYLERIERLNPALNAVVTLDVDRARAAASVADEDAAHDRWHGPLHGLPITIKDAIEVGGLRSTGGAVELAGHVPSADAPAVARLQAAGAIVFGKTNCPRWSGDLQTYNELFGTTNNPWSPDRVPGGSSGGAAAAVAAGFTAFEMGTDIGGSVRIPAHCCGVFGLKPSFGVVPQRGYLDHVGGGTTDPDINVFGPIARGAQDLDLLLGVLAGPSPEQSIAWRVELPAPRQAGVGDYRVGVWLEEPGVPADREQQGVLRAAADRLADAGAKVEDAHPPVDFGAQRDLFFQLIAAAISPRLPGDAGESIAGSHRAWLAADERRAGFRASWARWFETYDILLCPCCRCQRSLTSKRATSSPARCRSTASTSPTPSSSAGPGSSGSWACHRRSHPWARRRAGSRSACRSSPPSFAAARRSPCRGSWPRCRAGATARRPASDVGLGLARPTCWWFVAQKRDEPPTGEVAPA